MLRKYFYKNRIVFYLLIFNFFFSCAGGESSPVSAQENMEENQQESSATVLGIQGDKFTINGTATFLLGVSYFDGRGWRESDFDELSAKGFNLVRIWLFWRNSFPEGHFFDSNAEWKNGVDDDLVALVDYASSKGLIVDVSILQANLPFTDSANRLKAVQKTSSLLAGFDNVFFDISNEHDHDGNATIAHNEIEDLINAVKAIDPDRIVTVSSQGDHILPGNNRGSLIESNVDAELNAGVEFFTPHFLRTGDWAERTGERVQVIKKYLQSVGRNMPIYLQEENRRFNDSGPSEQDFITAAKQARDSGGAAWVFHTGAGMSLLKNNTTFFNSLDSIEEDVMNSLGTEIFGQQDNTAPAPPENLRTILD